MFQKIIHVVFFFIILLIQLYMIYTSQIDVSYENINI